MNLKAFILFLFVILLLAAESEAYKYQKVNECLYKRAFQYTCTAERYCAAGTYYTGTTDCSNTNPALCTAGFCKTCGDCDGSGNCITKTCTTGYGCAAGSYCNNIGTCVVIGAPPTCCGDGKCTGAIGETCSNCPQDCGSCYAINCTQNQETQTFTNDTYVTRIDIYIKHESEAWPASPQKTCLNVQTCSAPMIGEHVGIYQVKMVWTHNVPPYEGVPQTCSAIPNPKQIINLTAYTIECELMGDGFCPSECNATTDFDCVPEWEEVICNTTSPTGKAVNWGRYECGLLNNINVSLMRTEACIGLWTTDVILYASDEVSLHRQIDKKTIQIEGYNTASVILTYDVDEHNVTARSIEFSAGEPANETNATLIFCNGTVIGDCEKCMDIDTGACYVPEVVINDFVDSGGNSCDNTGNASQNYCTDAGGWVNNTDLYQDVCCCLSSGYWDGKCCDFNDYWLSSDEKWICANGEVSGYFAGNGCKTSLDNANLCEYNDVLGLYWNNNNWSSVPPSSCFCKTDADCNAAAGEICLNNICLVPSSAEISFLQKTIEVFDSQTATILLKITNNMIIDDKIHLELNSGNELDYWSWFAGQKENSNRTQIDLDINAESSKIVAIEVFGGKLGNYNLTATGFSYVTSGISGLEPIRDSTTVRIIPSPKGIYAKNVPDLSYISVLIIALFAIILYKKF